MNTYIPDWSEQENPYDVEVHKCEVCGCECEDELCDLCEMQSEKERYGKKDNN